MWWTRPQTLRDNPDELGREAFKRYYNWLLAREQMLLDEGKTLGATALRRIIVKMQHNLPTNIPKMFWTGILE